VKKSILQKVGGLFAALLLVPVLTGSLAGCSGPAAVQAADKAAAPFFTDRVIAVRFVMSAENWADLRKNAVKEEYVRADMWYDGELIPDIALRPKGNSSLSMTIGMNSIKFGLKADLNFFNSARSLNGVKKLNFNNGFSDPTFIRERLSYELFEQMGLPTPRSAFVDVWINDIHLGLYDMVEQVDQAFLGRYFPSATGNLYKPEMPASYLKWTEADLKASATGQKAASDNLDINLGGGNFGEILKALGQESLTGQKAETPPTNTPGMGKNGGLMGPNGLKWGGEGDLLQQMCLKTNENKPDSSALFRLLEVLNKEPDETFAGEIEKVLDVDQVLRYLAVSTVLVHLDNYTGMGHNYYLYEVDGKFTIIPWDLNMSFGNLNCNLNLDRIINFFIDEPTAGALKERPLVARLLSVPAFLETYHRYLTELMDGPFSYEVMASRIDELANMIRPYVKADSLKFFPTTSFEKYIGTSTDTGDVRFFGMGLNIGLKYFVTERIKSIEKQLSGELPSANHGQGNGGYIFMPGN
jgi:spore coat protein CotH